MIADYDVISHDLSFPVLSEKLCVHARMEGNTPHNIILDNNNNNGHPKPL